MPTMNYLLRSVDTKDWDRARRRAQRRGHTMRYVLLQAIKRYGAAERQRKDRDIYPPPTAA